MAGPIFRRCWLAAGALALQTGVAFADTSYVRPNLFTTVVADRVTAQSSFTEDFSNPNIAVRSDAWTLIKPDGSMAPPDRVETFTQLTILETTLTGGDGTYRLSTGERLGRVGPQVLENGVWRPYSPGRDIPEGTPTRQSQTATVADVYITRGAPTRAAVDARIGALQLLPVTHPNDVYLDTGFEFRVLLNGEPVANQQVEMWREGGAYEEPQYRKHLTSDDSGLVTVQFDTPGVYLIWTRLSAPAPAGAQTPIRSYTTSLTLEVQP
ncbi:MAG: DUF4198 domain-containing protein [Hyphomonadaceae bacterium]